MLSDMDFTLIIFIAVLVINYITDKTNKNADPINRFRIMLIGFGIVSLLLLFNLPSTSVSNQLQPGQEPDELIRVIQQQKESLLKLKQVIQGFVILFVFLFLPNLIQVLKLTSMTTNPETLEKDEKDDWERKRAKGKRYFILTRGFLWFLYTLLMFSILDWIDMGRIRLLDFRFFGEELFTVGYKIKLLVLKVLLYGFFYAIGCYYALNQWDEREKWYTKILEKQNLDSKKEVLS